jgi:hypothetical protein
MIKQQKFDILCFQETMVKDISESCFSQVDLGREYLWDWSPSSGKLGGLLFDFKVDKFDVGSIYQGDFVLQHNLWDEKLGVKWNVLNVYVAAQGELKDNFLVELGTGFFHRVADGRKRK